MQETLNCPKVTYLEFKCIHAAFLKSVHHETFVGEASSALGPHADHKSSRIMVVLNRNVKRITTGKKLHLNDHAKRSSFQ